MEQVDHRILTKQNRRKENYSKTDAQTMSNLWEMEDGRRQYLYLLGGECMKEIAKLIAWVYFIFVFVFNILLEMDLWLSVVFAGAVLMQTMGWMRISKVMAVVAGLFTLFWITTTTSIAGCFDILYAGFFTYYFWQLKK